MPIQSVTLHRMLQENQMCNPCNLSWIFLLV